MGGTVGTRGKLRSPVGAAGLLLAGTAIAPAGIGAVPATPIRGAATFTG